MSNLTKALLWGFGLAMIASVFAPRDDSDPPNSLSRSGMTIYVDALTGCEYLARGGFFGSALTPRLDKRGQQLCRGGAK